MTSKRVAKASPTKGEPAAHEQFAVGTRIVLWASSIIRCALLLVQTLDLLVEPTEHGHEGLLVAGLGLVERLPGDPVAVDLPLLRLHENSESFQSASRDR